MANKSLTATARKSLLRRGRAILRRYQGAAAAAEGDLLDALSETERYQLEEIHAALERIERGIFGRCETCFDKLDAARITALPWLRCCDRCAEETGGDRPMAPASEPSES